MTNTPGDILSDSFLDEGRVSRKTLIPLWIKIFAWLFIVFAFMTPLAFVGGIIMHNFALSLYGLEAYTPYSIMAVFLTTLFIFKGIVAFGILRREDWAINLGIIDAILGIIICIVIMTYLVVTNTKFVFRLELIALVPYLVKLLKIKDEWQFGRKD
jgi:hypothetical protein